MGYLPIKLKLNVKSVTNACPLYLVFHNTLFNADTALLCLIWVVKDHTFQRGNITVPALFSYIYQTWYKAVILSRLLLLFIPYTAWLTSALCFLFPIKIREVKIGFVISWGNKLRYRLRNIRRYILRSKLCDITVIVGEWDFLQDDDSGFDD